MEAVWEKFSPAVKECMSKAQEARALLAAKPDLAIPDSLKQQLESLFIQLTAATKQLSAQFEVAHKSADRIKNLEQGIQEEIVTEQAFAWSGLFRIGILEPTDLLRHFHYAPLPEHTSYLYQSACSRNLQIALRERDLHACKLLEQTVLLPKRVAAITEVGCRFGLRTLTLSHMARVGGIEPHEHALEIAKSINSCSMEVGAAGSKLSFDGTTFSPKTVFQFPPDAFDLVYFSRKAWDSWTAEDNNLVLSALTELSHKCHFLFFTSPTDSLPKKDLIEAAYDVRMIGQGPGSKATDYFFLATRRFVSIAETFTPIFDIRLHDPGWQGWDNLNTPSSTPLIHSAPLLAPRRLLIGFGKFIQTYLARAGRLDTQQHATLVQSEIDLWKTIGNTQPYLPHLVQTHADPSGHHFIFETPHTVLKFPQAPYTDEERHCLVAVALRTLKYLRQNNVFPNFLRVMNFILADKIAYLSTLARASSVEQEDHISAFLWFLHDLANDQLKWHDWPIERFDPYKAKTMPPEFILLASIALKSPDIDAFLDTVAKTPETAGFLN